MRRFSWLLIPMALLGACDRDGRIDAGGDGGTDAGPPPADTGVDAAPEDAPSTPDAGPPPTPLETSTEDARTDLAALVSASDGADPSLLDVGQLLRLDAVEARLDAIIGEKVGNPIDGIIGEKSTLALRRTYGVITVVERHVLQASIEAAEVESGLPADAMLDPLRTALQDLLVSLAALRAELLTLRDRIAGLDATLPGREDVAYVDAREVHLVPDHTTLHAILEGSPTDTDGSIGVTCSGTSPIDVVATDQDGMSLVAATGSGPHNFTMRGDRPTLLRIDVRNSGLYSTCRVQIQGRRHFRGPATVLSGPETVALRTRASDWDTEMSSLLGNAFMMSTDGGPDGAILAPMIEEYARELSTETSKWRGMTGSIDPEDLDVLDLALKIEIALSTRLEASPQIAPVFLGTNVVANFAMLRGMNEAMRADLASP